MLDWKWHNGRSIRFYAAKFTNFRNVIDGYDSLDVDVKLAAMKAASSVVSIQTRTGLGDLFSGSGTIIEWSKQDGLATILTSATLLRGHTPASASLPSDIQIDVYLSNGVSYEGQVLAYDCYYNLAALTIQCFVPLPTATLCLVDDSLALRKPLLGKHSNKFKLHPNERVIALARDSSASREIMASPGVFCAHDCHYDCKELFLTSCIVTKLAVGGPVVNYNGEVIGVNFFINPLSAFIPINIVSRWLEDFKRQRQVARPWLGASITNLFLADLEILDNLCQKFPNVSSGVVVEKVVGKRSIGSANKGKVVGKRSIVSANKGKVNLWTFKLPRDWLIRKAVRQNANNRKQQRMRQVMTRTMKGTKSMMKKRQRSPAGDAGLCVGDVIIKCAGVSVGSHLEFVEALWDKQGKSIDLVLIRPSTGQRNITLTVGTCPNLPRWYL